MRLSNDSRRPLYNARIWGPIRSTSPEYFSPPGPARRGPDDPSDAETRRFRDDDAATPGQQRDVWIEEGEFIVVPRGVEHRPVAEEEAEVLLFEPASTLNTGNVADEFTKPKLEWL